MITSVLSNLLKAVILTQFKAAKIFRRESRSLKVRSLFEFLNLKKRRVKKCRCV